MPSTPRRRTRAGLVQKKRNDTAAVSEASETAVISKKRSADTASPDSGRVLIDLSSSPESTSRKRPRGDEVSIEAATNKPSTAGQADDELAGHSGDGCPFRKSIESTIQGLAGRKPAESSLDHNFRANDDLQMKEAEQRKKIERLEAQNKTIRQLNENQANLIKAKGQRWQTEVKALQERLRQSDITAGTADTTRQELKEQLRIQRDKAEEAENTVSCLQEQLRQKPAQDPAQDNSADEQSGRDAKKVSYVRNHIREVIEKKDAQISAQKEEIKNLEIRIKELKEHHQQFDSSLLVEPNWEQDDQEYRELEDQVKAIMAQVRTKAAATATAATNAAAAAAAAAIRINLEAQVTEEMEKAAKLESQVTENNSMITQLENQATKDLKMISKFQIQLNEMKKEMHQKDAAIWKNDQFIRSFTEAAKNLTLGAPSASRDA
ncbi:hypothetical protein B0T17DRAFT_617202 [Bombardia bombarda]|uniref:Uncharacterized protein n=1 Tax=Bombardia bombarda TaxID=252184 RepID=A0AA39X0K6_9PEZI|nr:hypothetical protein B0T17DRAFT_617202 [Bombardia bombarda]